MLLILLLLLIYLVYTLIYQIEYINKLFKYDSQIAWTYISLDCIDETISHAVKHNGDNSLCVPSLPYTDDDEQFLSTDSLNLNMELELGYRMPMRSTN